MSAPRPATAAFAGRGIALVAVVAALVAAVLAFGFDDDDTTVSAGGTTTTAPTTTAPPDAGTTTTAAATSVPAAGDAKVIVANAAGVSGAAGRMGETLKGAGFTVVGATNASPKVSTTIVYFTEGFQSQATAVAAAIGVDAGNVKLMPTPAPVADLQGANVLVLLGTDKAK